MEFVEVHRYSRMVADMRLEISLLVSGEHSCEFCCLHNRGWFSLRATTSRFSALCSRALNMTPPNTQNQIEC